MGLSLLTRFRKGASNYIKSFDNFGKAITFTYKGEEEFKTFIGGVMSLFAFVILVIYAQLMIRVMLDRNDTNKSISTSVTNLYDDTDEVLLENTTFDFAFKFIGIDYADLTNPSLFDLTLTQVKYTRDSDGVWQFSNETIEYENCTNDMFKYDNKQQLTQIDFSTYICPKTKDFRVMGDSFSDRFTYFELSLKK